MLTLHEIREKYLAFFKDKGHTVIPSASLVPDNDPTTLFTGSGMQPMLPYLLGEKHPEGNRITDSQKCFRTEEFNEVGDNRHTTFFEMLGNWSFGDYFKSEQISWIFEFLTKELGLDSDKLYVAVYRGNEAFSLPKDTESAKIWKREFKKVGIDAYDVDFAERDGMQRGRIFYYPDSKNWWSRVMPIESMPVGEPGGPDSEIFYDFGPSSTSSGQAYHDPEKFGSVCHINCDCGRFLEIGNSVFMMYKKTENGFEELPSKNIDFGGGLERTTAAVQNTQDMFKIDVFEPIRKVVEEVSQKKYGEDEEETFAFRVIMDHLRAATFLIGDGVLPANKDQGYYSRRLIRRSVRFAYKLDIKENFTKLVAEVVAEEYRDAYPNLLKNKDEIMREMDTEEIKFGKTLENGLNELNKLIQEGKVGKVEPGGRLPIFNKVDAKKVFFIYQTYGFPLEMIQEELASRGLLVVEKEFNEEMKKHQEISRKGAEQKFKGGLADHGEVTVKYHTATHLLHAALREILGDHVEQRGSNITQDRLRFDFSHSQKMADEEIQKVEKLVNHAIEKNYPVSWQEMTVEEALEKGAMGLFEEKYGNKVKVYSIGDPEASAIADLNSSTFSREICGGPHVENTGVIGKFKITKEQAASSGVRRIKAIIE